MKKFFTFLMIVLMSMSACSIKNENNIIDPSSSNVKPVQVSESENKTLEDNLKKAIIDAHDNNIRGKIEILKEKKYEKGYLVLTIEKGEGGGIALYYVENEEGENFIVKGIAGGEAAMSIGFGVNRVIIDNHTILFCNLNESTWIPENDTRKETKYSRIAFEFENDNKAEETVADKNGYILIFDGIVHVKDMKLYNAKNKLVNIYKDVNTTTEVNYRLIQSK